MTICFKLHGASENYSRVLWKHIFGSLSQRCCFSWIWGGGWRVAPELALPTVSHAKLMLWFTEHREEHWLRAHGLSNFFVCMSLLVKKKFKCTPLLYIFIPPNYRQTTMSVSVMYICLLILNLRLTQKCNEKERESQYKSNFPLTSIITMFECVSRVLKTLKICDTVI